MLQLPVFSISVVAVVVAVAVALVVVAVVAVVAVVVVVAVLFAALVLFLLIFAIFVSCSSDPAALATVTSIPAKQPFSTTAIKMETKSYLLKNRNFLLPCTVIVIIFHHCVQS